MIEIRAALKRLLLYAILLIVPVLNNVGGDFMMGPLNSLAAIYLVFLSVILIYYYYDVVAFTGITRKVLIGIAVMILFWYVARFAKFKLFHEAESIKRFCWYLYYMPMLSIAQLFFYATVYMDKGRDSKFSKKLYWMSGVTAGLIVLVLTNDFHQLVFSFQENYLNWDASYTHGVLYFIVIFWESMLYLFSFVNLVKRCRVSNLKRIAWIVLTPFAIGIVIMIITLFGWLKYKGLDLIDITTTFTIMIAAFIDMCLQIGLIPSNKSYSKVLKAASLDVFITDNEKNAVYASDKGRITDASTVSAWLESGQNPIIDGNTAIRYEKIRNGYGFWKQDITEINNINEELSHLQEMLREEGELFRLENELKEKRVKLEARTRLYDNIAYETKDWLEKIYKLANDNSEKNILANMDKSDDVLRACRLICIYAVFIKRYANLMLLYENREKVSMMELALSLQESLGFLNGYGIPGDCLGDAYIEVDGNKLLAIYKTFGKLIEYDLNNLRAVYVRILPDGLVKLTLEGIIVELLDENIILLEGQNLTCEVLHEDNNTYVRIGLGFVDELADEIIACGEEGKND